MKSVKLFKVSFEKAEVFYSVFKECLVYVLVLNGDMIPVYDFSGNNMRSTLNSLRKAFSDPQVDASFSFYCKCCYGHDPRLALPFHFSFYSCYVYL